MRKALAVVLAAFVVTVVVIVALTAAGSRPAAQPDHREFCFSEWCVTPVSLSTTSTSTVVRVEVRSDARAATQRPDHPQAWLADSGGRMVGGPQARLAVEIGREQSYVAELPFPVMSSGCSTFVVAEGSWPAFLGLGYTPSPFTERVNWELCVTPPA